MAIHSKDGIDWEGIRAAAVAVGVIEAARQTAAPLPEPARTRLVERIRKRAFRQHWLDSAQQAVSVARQSVPVDMSQSVPGTPLSGADAVAVSVAESRGRSQVAISRAISKRAEHVADQPAERIAALELSHLATAHQRMHGGGEESSRVVVPVQINIG